MSRNSTWLLLTLGLLAAGCPMVGGAGGNGNENNNGNNNNDNGDSGNDNGDLPQNLVALFEAELDGAQEIPPVASLGTGFGSVGVTADDEFVIQVNASGLTGPVTTAHIHLGNMGVSGDIVLHLTENIVETDGMVTINVTMTEADFEFSGRQTALDALRAGVLYFNLHTELNPAGEIRGQLFEFDGNPAKMATARVDETGIIAGQH